MIKGFCRASRPGWKPAVGLLRGKSSLAQRTSIPEMRKDDFPFSKITDTQFEQWDNQLRESPLALKAFFAQHRPLMTMQPEPQNSTDIRDVMFVHVWQPKGVSLHEAGFQVVPQEIASEVGPFHVAQAANQKNSTAPAPAAAPLHSQVSMTRGRGDQVHTIQETIGLIGSILDRYNNQGKGRLVQVPMLDVDVVEELAEEDVDATSVRRKRKLKMNRHKYRKRLKAQRSQRRRLNK